MERLRSLNRYQKFILILLILMLLCFAAVYFISTARVGYEYQGKVLVVGTENGNTVYSGTIQGQPCKFTVTADKTVSFQCGDTVYGPYTAIEDPTAIPAEYTDSAAATGIELRLKEKILFRGCALKQSSGFFLVDENGEMSGFSVVAVMSDGTRGDENGKKVDPWEPGIYSILELMGQPTLTKKGKWPAFLLGALISLITAVSILFADELFRLDLAFRVRDWERTEPSDFEIAGRYISWTILPVMALWVYIIGLH